MKVTPGATDVTTYFVMRLAADGTEATGLTITNFDLQYVRSGEAPTAKVDATALAATNSAHGDNQAIEIDATDQPGLYRVDWPDAAFAAGVREVVLSVKCATCFTEHLRVELETIQTGDNFARLGAPAGASVSADVAAIKAQTAAIETDTAEIGAAGAGLTNINLPNQTMDIIGNITGNLSGSVGSVTGAVGSVTGNVGGNVAGSVGSLTTNNDKTGYALSAAGNNAAADQVWDEALAGHAGAGSTGAALSAAGAAGDPWSTLLPGAYGAGTAGDIIGNYVPILANVSYGNAELLNQIDLIPKANGILSFNSDCSSDMADALLNRDMATGIDTGSTTERTVRQALRLSRNKVSIAAGTLTVCKEDDSTTSWTAVLTGDPTAEPIVTVDPAGP